MGKSVFPKTDGKIIYSIQLAHSKTPWELVQTNLENKNVRAARERRYNVALILEKGLIG